MVHGQEIALLSLFSSTLTLSSRSVTFVSESVQHNDPIDHTMPFVAAHFHNGEIIGPFLVMVSHIVLMLDATLEFKVKSCLISSFFRFPRHVNRDVYPFLPFLVRCSTAGEVLDTQHFLVLMLSY